MQAVRRRSLVDWMKSLAQAATVMGIAPPGGRIPDQWRAVLLEAIDKGMDILSGLHDFLSDDPELSAAAARRGTKITDVAEQLSSNRTRQGLNPDCLRVHTVGHDCSVGKMVVSLEITNGLKKRGVDAQFVATGQTGIMVSGAGLPLDCIVADFVAGGAEKLVLDNQHHEVILIEGQGSLVHPSYSGVTLGLLHGCLPHAMIMIFEAGPIQPWVDSIMYRSRRCRAIRELFEIMASVHQPCPTIGIAMNGRRLNVDEAKKISQQVEDEMQLPVVDVLREGPERLVEAVDSFRKAGTWRS